MGNSTLLAMLIARVTHSSQNGQLLLYMTYRAVFEPGLWCDLTAYLLPDFDKGFLNLHGVEAIQGVGHPHTAGIAAVLPGDRAKPAHSEASETKVEF